MRAKSHVTVNFWWCSWAGTRKYYFDLGENFFRIDQKFRFISILARIKLKSGDSGWSYEKFRILDFRFPAEYKVPNVNHMIISV